MPAAHSTVGGEAELGGNGQPSLVIVARGVTDDEAERISRALNAALRIGVVLIDVTDWQSFAEFGEMGG